MSASRKTFVDLSMGLDPKGDVALVFEVLSRMYPMLLDGPAGPSNADFGNEVTIRTALPAVTRRRVNQGIDPTKSAKSKRNDTIGIYSGRSEVDCAHVDIFGADRVKAERQKEDEAFIESMGQAAIADAIYGNEKTDSAGFTGLAARMSSLSTSLSDSQVRSMGSVTGGDGTSVYAIDWGEKRGAQYIYPKNHGGGSGGGKLGALGLKVRDLGEQDVEDENSKRFRAYVTSYEWMFGLTLNDPRHVGRLCNIDTSDANTTSPTQGSIYDALTDLLVHMAPPAGLQRVLYCTRELYAGFIKQANNKVAAGGLTREEYLGTLVPHFMGYPIRFVDAISGAESTVS